MSTRRVSSRPVVALLLGALLSLGLVASPSPVLAASPCPCSIWNDAITPATLSAADAKAVEVGVRFRSSSSGFITGLRFFKGPDNTGTHVGHLWTNLGLSLATVTFTSETATGWQQMALSTPVAISAGTTYVASYFAPNGGYAFNRPFFDGAGFTNLPLTALADGADGPNGIYLYGGGFPTETFVSSNYWVDVVFQDLLHRPSLPALVTNSTQWSLRDSITTGPATNTFSFGTRPLAPLTGDWDGNGSKTPGFFNAGTFYLSNSIVGPNLPTDATFTFGDPRGFPVAGDFNGDGTEDVAVYKAGVWQVRYSDGTVVPAFSFGPGGNWPATVPVAGDWDGDGIDGIGSFSFASGTWTLRNTASAGAPDIVPFIYWAGPGSYPVIGDWDGNGTDTLATKNGVTWYLRNSNTAGPAEATFDFGGASDLPLRWSKP